MIRALCGLLATPGSWLAIWTRTGGEDSPPPVAASRRERAVYGDHRRAAGVDGVDDLGVVDALQVDPAPRGAMRKEMTDDNISSVLAGMPALG